MSYGTYVMLKTNYVVRLEIQALQYYNTNYIVLILVIIIVKNFKLIFKNNDLWIGYK